MTRTDALLASLDAVAIAWVVVVVMNPFDYLVELLGGMLKAMAIAVTFLPPLVGLLMAVNGVDQILSKVAVMYLIEVFGCVFLVVSLFSLRGVVGLIKGVAAVYQLMISVPCWFVLGTIAYWSW